MNILVITPLYYIKGRPNLFHDTSAIHYLIRPWAKEHEVTVINIYMQGFRKIARYLSRKEREYYWKGYHYSADGVDVHMCEVQLRRRQKWILRDTQTTRVKKYIEAVMQDKGAPDLVVVHFPTICMSLLESIYPGVKKVAVLHQSDIINCNEGLIKGTQLNTIYSRMYARSAVIRDALRKKSIKVEEDIIYSGVPFEFKKEPGKVKPSEYKVVYVGKLIERKNVDKCIRCLGSGELSRNISFGIYGAGEEQANLEELQKKMKLADKITFHGQVSHDKIAGIMQDADIFIMISTKETFGLVYLEALSAGCIVIGSRNEGIDGVIVDGKNGFLINPDNDDDLKNCLENIFNMDGEKYTEISQNANATALEYTEEKMGRRYLNLISSCCNVSISKAGDFYAK